MHFFLAANRKCEAREHFRKANKKKKCIICPRHNLGHIKKMRHLAATRPGRRGERARSKAPLMGGRAVGATARAYVNAKHLCKPAQHREAMRSG